MSFAQVIPFDTARGGNVPNLCLANVCQGYGIGNKYGSAWEAWGHTQQHQDRNIPAGLSVPIFYSYTATINGVTANYGHINVQLPNGAVWSDGNLYASIADYESKKYPRFVGWGESVNDFKIIEGGDMSASQDNVDETAVKQAYDIGLLRDPTQQEIDSRVGSGQTLQAMQSSIIASDEHKEVISDRGLGVKLRTIVGDNSITPDNLEATLEAKYGTLNKQSVIGYINQHLS